MKKDEVKLMNKRSGINKTLTSQFCTSNHILYKINWNKVVLVLINYLTNYYYYFRRWAIF